MTEIYRANRRPLDWREGKGAGIVTAWWIIRLLADVIGLTTLQMRFDYQEIVTTGTVFFCAVTVIHQILPLIIVTCVTRWQTAGQHAARIF